VIDLMEGQSYKVLLSDML